MNYTGAATATVSSLVVDADLNLLTFKIKTNHITESTAGHGVECDVKSNLMLWGG
jgi:hypothetical protein